MTHALPETSEKNTEISLEPLIPILSDIATQNKNILIVDDSFEMRRYLKNIFGNYNCYEAADGEQALKVIETETIDCIICDYMMPIMDGPTFVQNLNKSNHDIPVLILTARNDRNSKLKLLKLRIEEYITKPFDKEELLIRINSIS